MLNHLFEGAQIGTNLGAPIVCATTGPRLAGPGAYWGPRTPVRLRSRAPILTPYKYLLLPPISHPLLSYTTFACLCQFRIFHDGFQNGSILP